MSQVVKNPPANSGIIRDTCLISESEKPFGGEHGNPLQYSYPKNPMGRGAWWAIVHRVAESQAWLKCFSMNMCIQKWICPHYQHLFRSCWGLFNYFYSTVFLVNNSTLNIHWKDWCWSSILWPPDVKSQLIGRPWCWERMGKKRRWQRMRRLDGITGSMDMKVSKLPEMVKDREAWCAEVHRVPKNQTWPSNWTATGLQNQNSRNHGPKISLYLSPCSVVVSPYSFSFSSFLKELQGLVKNNNVQNKGHIPYLFQLLIPRRMLSITGQ